MDRKTLSHEINKIKSLFLDKKIEFENSSEIEKCNNECEDKSQENNCESNSDSDSDSNSNSDSDSDSDDIDFFKNHVVNDESVYVISEDYTSTTSH